MKRTLELLSFVAFVSLVMFIILLAVAAPKNSVNGLVEKRSEKVTYALNKLKTLTSASNTY
jgi:hypothetical protein